MAVPIPLFLHMHLEYAFKESLVQNKEPLISGRDVLAAMRAIYAAAESSVRGCAVNYQSK